MSQTYSSNYVKDHTSNNGVFREITDLVGRYEVLCTHLDSAKINPKGVPSYLAESE